MERRTTITNYFYYANFAVALCEGPVARIGRIWADGRELDQVRGNVTRGAGILGIGAYEVDDGSGRIVVIARGQGVPADGTATRVKGTFQSVFSLAGRTIAAILQGDSGR